jgi:hypothetical protein
MCRRIQQGSTIEARYGVNNFLVTYADVTAEQFPEHVTNATLFGRLVGRHTLVNVDISLTHDATVRVAVPCSRRRLICPACR